MRRLFRPYKHLGAGAALKSMPHTAHCPSSLCTPTTQEHASGAPCHNAAASTSVTLSPPPRSVRQSPPPSPPRRRRRRSPRLRVRFVGASLRHHARLTPGSRPARLRATPLHRWLATCPRSRRPPCPPPCLRARFASTPASPSPSPRLPPPRPDSPGLHCATTPRLHAQFAVAPRHPSRRLLVTPLYARLAVFSPLCLRAQFPATPPRPFRHRLAAHLCARFAHVPAAPLRPPYSPHLTYRPRTHLAPPPAPRLALASLCLSHLHPPRSSRPPHPSPMRLTFAYAPDLSSPRSAQFRPGLAVYFYHHLF